MNIAARWPRSAAAVANCAARVDLPVPAAPMMSVLVPASRPPPRRSSIPQEIVDPVDGARELVLVGEVAVLGRHQARIDLQPAGGDDVVVVAAAELAPAVLQHPHAAAIGAVLGQQLLEDDHAVRDALHLQVAPGAGEVVQQQHGAAAAAEELLQRQQLAAVAQRIAREQPQLRQRIEHQARGLQPLHVLEDGPRGLGELDLGRMEHRVLLRGLQALLRRHQLADGDAAQVEAVRLGHRLQLFLGLRERHVEDRVPLARALHQVLHRERGLARPGHALDQVQPVGCEAAAEDVVQAVDARGGGGVIQGAAVGEVGLDVVHVGGRVCGVRFDVGKISPLFAGNGFRWRVETRRQFSSEPVGFSYRKIPTAAPGSLGCQPPQRLPAGSSSPALS
jgi:hypothetical protein